MRKTRITIVLLACISTIIVLAGISLAGTIMWDGGPNDIYWNSGNVGIGTTSPSGKLDVSGSTGSDTTLLLRNPGFASTDSATLQIETTNAGDADPTIRFNIPDFTSWYLGVDNSDADKLKIGTGLLGSADILTIVPSGRIGIGTSDPGDSHVRIWNTALSTDTGFQGLYIYENKTAGSGTGNHHYGIYNYMRMSQANGQTGHLYGIYSRALLSNGTVGNNLYGGYFTGETDSGTVTGSVIGTQALSNIDGGAVSGSVFGLNVSADVESAASVGGNVYGGYINIDCDSDPAGTAYGLYLYTRTNVDYGIYVIGNAVNYFAGNVGIGTTSPQSKLAVNGTITTKEVNVTDTGWSDFVFEKGYNLRSLNEVEDHIKEKKHLPDIPSAKEIEKNGLNMAEMMSKQMQKIEELTLYVIEQNKKMGDLLKKNMELEKRLADLEKEK